MAIQISDHFTLGRLARFTAPTCAMMLFTSIYGVIDGLFVSNFVGKESFAALNLVYPLFMMLGALGYMFGTGGTALVAKTMGEGDDKRARGLFSLIVYATLIVGIACGAVVLAVVGSVAGALGAEGSLLEECVVYGSILAFSLPFFMLQETFQSLLTAAGKPKVGGFQRAMARMGAAPEETAIVGDQIFTDIWGGNRAGVLTLLVHPIQFGTVFRGLRYGLETPFRAGAGKGAGL